MLMSPMSLAFAALFVSAWFSSSCSSDAPEPGTALPAQAAVLESISPSSGPPGTAVVIRGSGFTSTDNDVAFRYPISAQKQQTAYLNGLSSSDTNTLRFSLPDNGGVLLGACAMTQLKPGEACPDIGYELPTGESHIFVINKNGESNSVTFTVSEPGPR